MIRYLLRSCPWAADPGPLKECILLQGRAGPGAQLENPDREPSLPRLRPRQGVHHLHTAEGGAPLSLQNQTLVFSTRILTGHLKIMLNQTSGLSAAWSGWQKIKYKLTISCGLGLWLHHYWVIFNPDWLTTTHIIAFY